MCRVLGVSSSGYYAWVKRRPSARTLTDAALIVEIRAAHAASKGTYGAPRIQIDLADAGIRVSRKRVARLMRNAGLAGVSRRKGTVTTVRDGARQAPDLVDRNFTADRPNMLWVADITYIPTWAGFLYLAVVLDAFSRRIVGWSMATTLAHAGGARRPQHGALAAAAERRDPPFGSGLAIYLDRVRQTLSRGGCPPLDGVGRRRLRQRNGGELLRHARMRVARSASLQDAGRGAHCRLRVHRGLLQSAPAALIARVSVTHQVRVPICSDGSRTRCTRACCRARARQGAAWKPSHQAAPQRAGRP